METAKNEIQIPTNYSKRLELEFGTSKQTVYKALKDSTKSELAKQIRLRAKEMLIEQVTKIRV